MSLRAALTDKNKFNLNRIYITPNIPEKLVLNAINAYSIKVDPREVIILIDNTVLGNGKTGCLICDERIVFRDSFSSADAYEYSKIKSLEASKTKIKLNGSDVFDFQLVESKDIFEIFKTLNDLMGVEAINNISLQSENKEITSTKFESDKDKLESKKRMAHMSLDTDIFRFKDLLGIMDKKVSHFLAGEAINHLKYLHSIIEEGRYIDKVLDEGYLINRISNNIIELTYGRESVDKQLLIDMKTDSELVKVLRHILKSKAENNENDQRERQRDDEINDFLGIKKNH